MLMAECIVFASQPPSVTTGSAYTVRSGDTLTAIAARHGFASWREIYYHPDNEPFRKKRPNPDKIFPGDVLIIPGRPGDSVPVPAGIRSTPLTYALPQPLQSEGASSRMGVRPKNDQFDTNYRHPGGLRIRLTLFWVTNCMNMGSAAGPLLDRAEKLFRDHGLGLDVYPSRQPTAQHTIQTPANVVSAGGVMINQPPDFNHWNEVRYEASRRFDDQQTPGRRQRLPVIFCEFKYPSSGVTVIGSPWPAYVLVSGNLAPDRGTLAHEIIHAAGFGPHIPRPKNIMAETTDAREEIYRMHVEMVARAYFTR
jgi:LysM repeat protein